MRGESAWTMGDLVERRIGDLTIRIDRGTCISTGNCMKLAPEVFEFDAEKICAFRDPVGDVERDRLIEACHVCPVDALIVIDAAGKQLVP
jgi:ferredoxin